jgi:hypothetical protein
VRRRQPLRDGDHLRDLRGALQAWSARMMGWLDRFPLALLVVVALWLALRLVRLRRQRRPGP